MHVSKSSSGPPSRDSYLAHHWPLVLKALVIVVAGATVFYPTLFAPWYGDDDIYLTGNPLLQDPHRVWKAWFQPGSFIEYYPIEQTVQWMQWELFGLNSTFGYHLTNLILHLTSALLIWRLFDKLRLKWAWLGGLIFAIHPLMVDSVGVACELKNTLSLPPFLLSMCFYLDFENTRKPRYYFFALALFLVAMLCKITMYFFPVVILLYAWWKRGRIGWNDVKESLPFFVVSLALGLITLHAGVVYAQSIQYQSPAPIHLGGILNRIALGGLSLTFYLGRCFFPLCPMPFYPQWSLEPLNPLLFTPWLVIATTVVVCWAMRRSWGRPVLFALAFFTLGLAPFLGFNETSYMALTWFTDHFVYIPIIALIGLVVAGIEHPRRRLPLGFQPVEVLRIAVCLLLLGFQTYSYAKLFGDQEKLWIYNLRFNPKAWLAEDQLGQIYMQKQDVDKAIEHMQKSAQINPDFFNAHLYLGLYLSAAGRIPEGAAAFAQAVKIDPRAADGHFYLGDALRQLGRATEAIDQYNLALQIDPDLVTARSNLSEALAQQGRIPEAIAQMAAALRTTPDDPKLQARMSELQAEQQAQSPGTDSSLPK